MCHHADIITVSGGEFRWSTKARRVERERVPEELAGTGRRRRRCRPTEECGSVSGRTRAGAATGWRWPASPHLGKEAARLRSWEAPPTNCECQTAGRQNKPDDGEWPANVTICRGRTSGLLMEPATSRSVISVRRRVPWKSLPTHGGDDDGGFRADFSVCLCSVGAPLDLLGNNSIPSVGLAKRETISDRILNSIRLPESSPVEVLLAQV